MTGRSRIILIMHPIPLCSGFSGAAHSPVRVYICFAIIDLEELRSMPLILPGYTVSDLRRGGKNPLTHHFRPQYRTIGRSIALMNLTHAARSPQIRQISESSRFHSFVLTPSGECFMSGPSHPPISSSQWL
ncbi:hypothetical protein K474DRAFT_183537 [Panus rudis PR-1116 ss-1]|nr:hypothetical protein K474DRAFT_183537 [Panus rudis PR-1116 ss-1]